MPSGNQGPKHTFMAGPWHYCGICYFKCKIADMTRQRGVLRCPACTERSSDGFPLIGQRDQAIEQVLTDGKPELVPVEKLRDPDAFQDAEDFIL
jgi:hypothetical protein